MPNDIPRNADGDDYQDPLENYDPKTYEDPLRRALAEESVDAIQVQPYESVPPDMPVGEVVKKLVDLRIGYLLVEESRKLVGVFSERDVLNKIALEYDAVKEKPVSEFMTANPIVVHCDDSSAAALSVMAAAGCRHVPVVDLDENLIGIVNPQRLTGFLQSHFEDGDSSDESP